MSDIRLCFRFRYNTSDHPIPFHKAQDLGKAPKNLGGGPAPDIEDAYDVSYSLYSICLFSLMMLFSLRTMLLSQYLNDSKKKSPDDISNDKLIKTKKAKGKGKK